MKCPGCDFDNPAGFAFCGKCGCRLGLPCPVCGSDNPPGLSFCGKCGTQLAPAELPSSLLGEADLARLGPYLSPSQLDDLPPALLWRESHLASTLGHLSRLLDVVITYLPYYLVQTELAQPDTLARSSPSQA